jgi:hypothetical protein
MSAEKKRKSDKGKKLELAREEWAARQKKRRNRPRVYKKIASGQVGSESGQAEIIDLRTPSLSRSSSIEIQDIDQNGFVRQTFTLSPDTTTSRQTTIVPNGRPISDDAIHSLHHLSASLASTSLGREESLSVNQNQPTLDPTPRQTSEEAIIALHHISASIPNNTPISPDSHHLSSPSPKRRRKRARKSSRSSSTASDISTISESSIISLHHFKASQSSVPPNTRLESRNYPSNKITKLPVAMTPKRPKPVVPCMVVPDYRHGQEDTLESLSPPSSPSSISDTCMVDSLSSMQGCNDTTNEPIPNPDSIQASAPVPLGRHSEQTTSHQASEEPSTPRISSLSLNAHLSNIINTPITPTTPTRLGPAWKTETAPPSEVADEEYDELESENEDIWMSSPIFDVDNRLDGRPKSSSPSPFGLEPIVAQSDHQSQRAVGMDIQVESTAWAFTSDFNSEQWGERPTSSGPPTHLSSSDPERIAVSSDLNAPAPEAGDEPEVTTAWESTNNTNSDNEVADDEDDGVASSDVGTSDDESDDNDVEDRCGYRVFAGFSDLESVNSAQWDDSHRRNPYQTSRHSSFGPLSPRRPTALEATTGNGVCGRGSSSGYTSPVSNVSSSSGRVSAELFTPTTPPIADDINSESPSTPSRLDTALDYRSDTHLRLAPVYHSPHAPAHQSEIR